METIVAKLYRLNASMFRRRRFRRFLEKCEPQASDRVLDIGGTLDFWEKSGPIGRELDVLNIRCEEGAVIERNGCSIRHIQGDARALGCADNSYDLVFSNSVIEHVGSWVDQCAFAREARRAGKKIWIQTPAKYFFVEPHFLTLFIHWLPKRIQKKLIRYGSLWGLLAKPSPAQIDGMVEEIRLLTLPEMRILFPDCKIHKERFLGLLVKSYSAYR